MILETGRQITWHAQFVLAWFVYLCYFIWREKICALLGEGQKDLRQIFRDNIDEIRQFNTRKGRNKLLVLLGLLEQRRLIRIKNN